MANGIIAEALNVLSDRCHSQAVDKGWWDDPAGREVGTLIALMHSELSEALEEWRDNPNVNYTYFREDGKPEGVPAELADTIIRIMDFCGWFGIDIGAAVEGKLKFNDTRPHRHGGKHA